MASSHSPTERKAVKSGVLWSNSGLIGLRDEHKEMFTACVFEQETVSDEQTGGEIKHWPTSGDGAEKWNKQTKKAKQTKNKHKKDHFQFFFLRVFFKSGYVVSAAQQL